MTALAHFKKTNPPEVCALAFALVAEVLQDRDLFGSLPGECTDKLDQAALTFTSAASDAGRKAREGKE